MYLPRKRILKRPIVKTLTVVKRKPAVHLIVTYMMEYFLINYIEKYIDMYTLERTTVMRCSKYVILF